MSSSAQTFPVLHSIPLTNQSHYLLMANTQHHVTIPNANEPTKPLVVINASGDNIIKLTSTNYLSWKLQIEALLISYDIQEFIDGSHPSPAPTVTVNNAPIPNPEYNTWFCQDKLIFSACCISHPALANPANIRFSNRATYSRSSWPPHRHSTPQQLANISPPIDRSRPQPRPYLGRCQGCLQQGHTILQCSLFRVLSSTPPSTSGPRPSQHWQSRLPQRLQPRANIATAPVSETLAWLLDTSASHHVTTDLNNLFMHNPYDGSDDIVIGDGSALPIIHTGSTTLSTPSYDFSLQNVLFVPTMKKNLISISQFCKTNHISIEFLPTSFHVKDLRTGKILL
ncbi:hypothetical protein L6164_008660 [Bauhinia variegata]|uniref:Uncharacterized protein n=1 Tax=Bauhinia variegata TaxID=167791 RepID=A0ACB9PIP8_BAUVA|nr:hypothetical protein L6164_008660 [Bauhinia variegata]